MRQIASDVYHIPVMGRYSINCYIIEGVLIDSGIRQSFSKISRCLLEIPVHTHALTHAHPDHQGSSSNVCAKFNIPFYCHKNEAYRAESGLATHNPPLKNNPISVFQQAFWAGRVAKVDGFLKENDGLSNFKVIETPGHSTGHISFFREKDGVLIIGDVATNMNLLTTKSGLRLPPVMFTIDPHRNIESLKKLARLEPSIICFGHGPVLFNSDKEFERFADSI